MWLKKRASRLVISCLMVMCVMSGCCDCCWWLWWDDGKRCIIFSAINSAIIKSPWCWTRTRRQTYTKFECYIHHGEWISFYVIHKHYRVASAKPLSICKLLKRKCVERSPRTNWTNFSEALASYESQSVCYTSTSASYWMRPVCLLTHFVLENFFFLHWILFIPRRSGVIKTRTTFCLLEKNPSCC